MEVKKMFYTMGEVAEMFDVSSSLIRYWESQFKVIKPSRNKKGNRLFTPKDIENFKLIYHLVKERGMTLEGAKKSIGAGKLPISREAELMDRLLNMRSLLEEVREVLKEEDQSDTPGAQSEEATDSFDVEQGGSIDLEAESPNDVEPSSPLGRAAGEPNESGVSESRVSEEKELFAFYEQNLF